MTEAENVVLSAVLIGAGATVVMDIWGLAQRRLFGVPSPDYAVVGRWIVHLARGTFRHTSIATAARVRNEGVIGWMTHYAIGIAYAGLVFVLWGSDWAARPAIGPALIVGFGTLIVPFLIMQPSMGAGFAASRTPRPAQARLRSFANHGAFGLGLYAAAWLAAMATNA